MSFFRRIGSVLTYVASGVAGLGLAFYLSSQFLPSSLSQDPFGTSPIETDLPLPPPGAADPYGGEGAPVQAAPISEALPAKSTGAPLPRDSQPGAPLPRDSQPGAPLPRDSELAGQALANTQETLTKGFEIEGFLEPFIYDSEGRRDPFQPYVEMGLGSSSSGGASGPRLPIQRYDLDELQLVGIMWEVRAPKAMVMDPAEVLHVLRNGDRVGRNNGYIATIREGEIVVVESVKVQGELSYTTRVMRIKR